MGPDPKGDANIVFTSNNPDGKYRQEVVVQKIAADEQWPHKPKDVIDKVFAISGVKLSAHNHTQAWRRYGVRPRKGAIDPASCTKKFCTYHPAHGDYTYSWDWVEKLAAAVQDAEELKSIKATKL